MSVEERLRQQGVKVNGTLDIQAGFEFMRKAFVDEYGLIINFKLPEDEQEGGGGFTAYKKESYRKRKREVAVIKLRILCIAIVFLLGNITCFIFSLVCR